MVQGVAKETENKTKVERFYEKIGNKGTNLIAKMLEFRAGPAGKHKAVETAEDAKAVDELLKKLRPEVVKELAAFASELRGWGVDFNAVATPFLKDGAITRPEYLVICG